MNQCSVIFIETGLNIDIPDLKNRCSSIFPFWGNYKFIDFHISQLTLTDKIKKMLILDKNYSDAYKELYTRFFDIDISLIQLQNSIEEFLEILRNIEADKLVISSLSFIALYNESDLINIINKPVGNIIKISIGNTPVDMFVVNKKYFIGLLSESITQSRWKETFLSYLFTEILHSNFSKIKNIPGYFIFSNNLNNFYKANLSLINNFNKNYIQNTFIKLNNIYPDDNHNSTITKYGYVKNSLISSGVEINGFVENSVIFPGVITKKNSKIINSVIMNNNRIGSKAVIKNTLVLPFYREFMKNINSIEDKSEIGSENSQQIKNSEFPDHIPGSMTVIGIDTIIGREIIVEPGCYVSGNITVKNMENKKIVPEGTYIKK